MALERIVANAASVKDKLKKAHSANSLCMLMPRELADRFPYAACP